LTSIRNVTLASCRAIVAEGSRDGVEEAHSQSRRRPLCLLLHPFFTGSYTQKMAVKNPKKGEAREGSERKVRELSNTRFR
jgi:hypothetical protein